MLGFRRIVITTRLKVSDACAAIGAETQRARIPRGSPKSFFEGSVSNDGFELSRTGPFRNGIGPVIRGRITTGDGGTTTVTATMRMSIFGLVLLASMSAIATAWFIAGDRGGFVALFVLLVSVAAYELDAGRCEDRLRKALELQR
jgi:hypothetical protein